MKNVTALTTAKTLAEKTGHPHVVYRRPATNEFFVKVCSNTAMATLGVEKDLPEDCELMGFVYPDGRLLSPNRRRSPV